MPTRPRFVPLVFCLLLGAGPSAAQEASPSHLAAARELILATGSLTSIDEILPSLVEEVRKQAVTRPELVKDLDEVLKGLAPELELQRQQAFNIATRAYAKWLTEPEIRETLVFYKTPTGAKFARIQPELTEDVVNDIQGWSQQASEYVMVRTRVEMRKRGHQMQ